MTPSTLPAHKFLRVVKGSTFDYPFQYLTGTPTSSTPVSLVNVVAYWTLIWQGGQAVYSNLTPLTIGQIGVLGASPGRMQAGQVGANAAVERSGIFFGGVNQDPTNGTIDLVITASDTAVLPWTTATYALVLINPLTHTTTSLLAGAITTLI